MNIFENITTKKGYEIKTIVREEPDRDNPHGWYHAIVYNANKNEYIFCACYDIETGSWLRGIYCATYIGAIRAMYDYLKKWISN